MNRRDSIKLAALGAGVLAVPGAAFAAQPAPPLIYDSRFAAARAFAHGALAHDCADDAAILWFARFSGRQLPSGGLAGFTTMADALVLGDCARREGLRWALADSAADPSGLVHWRITA